MEFKKGDKVRVYDRTLLDGCGEGVILCFNKGEASHARVEIIGSFERYWFHIKQMELIEHTKQKVKLYKYAYKLKDVGRWDESLRFYSGDSEFTNCNPNFRTFKRLDSTMIEVDDE